MSNQLTPMQEAIDFIENEIRTIKYTSDYYNGKDSAFMTCLYKLEELLPKEQQVIEEYENLLDEITASIGNEYRLPFWIETKLNERRLSQH